MLMYLIRRIPKTSLASLPQHLRSAGFIRTLPGAQHRGASRVPEGRQRAVLIAKKGRHRRFPELMDDGSRKLPFKNARVELW